MANLKVAIVIRPGRPGYYLSYYEGSQQRYKKAGDNLDDAEIAKMRKEKVLRAASYGISLPEEPVRATKSHRIADCINWDLGIIRIVKKNKYGWTGKTKAARREVPLTEELLAELRLRQPGLLFPNASGNPEGHFLYTIQKLAKAANVVGTSDKPDMKAAGMIKNDWCHRFRDTYLTNQLHLCANMADLLMLCKRVGHKDTTTLDKYFGKLKKPYQPKLRLRKSSEKVIAIA